MITVKFTCKACGMEKVEVQVPARSTEDVRAWVESIAQMCGDEHCRRNPKCHSDRVDLMIPLPKESEFVGQQIE